MVYELATKQNPNPESVITLAFQPSLRPPLISVFGSADYVALRQLFERIDAILTESKLDGEFLALALRDQGIDPATLTGLRAAAFAQFSFVCLRATIAPKLTGLAHREFCALLADSPLLQWFLHVGRIDQVKVFAKSTSQVDHRKNRRRRPHTCALAVRDWNSIAPTKHFCSTDTIRGQFSR